MLAAFFILATCDLPGEVAPTTADERRETYATIRETCLLAGAAPVVCEVIVAKAYAESRGRPTLRHTKGKNELGFGLFGHNLKFWRWLLGRGSTADDFCDTRNGTLAMLREFRYAVKQGASKLYALQRVHAGRSPRNNEHPKADRRFCILLERGPWDDQSVVAWYVPNCNAPLDLGMLGREMSAVEALSFAWELERKASPSPSASE